MQLAGHKRNRNHMITSIEEQSSNKKCRILNQMMDGIHQYKNKNSNVIIQDVNITAKVKDYDVKIIKNVFGSKYTCSCTPDVYYNYQSNYCKHISMLLKEIIKDYLRENETFFQQKKQEELFRENIDFLKSSFKDININNADENPFSKK